MLRSHNEGQKVKKTQMKERMQHNRTTSECKQGHLPHITSLDKSAPVLTLYVGIMEQDFFNKFMRDGNVTTKSRRSRTAKTEDFLQSNFSGKLHNPGTQLLQRSLFVPVNNTSDTQHFFQSQFFLCLFVCFFSTPLQDSQRDLIVKYNTENHSRECAVVA